MGQSFKTYRDRILLSEMLDEIFDSEPFKNNFNFGLNNYKDVVITPFQDPQDNEIKIIFYNEGNGLYEIDFMVNNTSFKDLDVNYTLKDYTKLLSTVASATSQFLEKYKPLGLKIKGADDYRKIQNKEKAQGQKTRIYDYFISQIEDKGKYMVDKSNPEGIALMRK
ncbi:hypothetical protein N9795_00500 [Candidatus Pelagibacter sp.]|nr:hypothetical protein [Candidatus Pelagibacter sp.]